MDTRKCRARLYSVFCSPKGVVEEEYVSKSMRLSPTSAMQRATHKGTAFMSRLDRGQQV